MSKAIPLGVEPRWVWREKRQKELIAAISRYIVAGMVPLVDWVIELGDLWDEKRKEDFESAGASPNATLENVKEIAKLHGWSGNVYLSSWLDEKLGEAARAANSK